MGAYDNMTSEQLIQLYKQRRDQKMMQAEKQATMPDYGPGEITAPAPFYEKAIPALGEFAGSVGGTLAGATTAPVTGPVGAYAGGVAGGTAGYGVGKSISNLLRNIRYQGMAKKDPRIKPPTDVLPSGGEMLGTLGREAGGTALGIAGGAGAKFIGGGLAPKLFGSQAGKRINQVGFKPVMNPDYLSESTQTPGTQDLFSKMMNFFPRVLEATGKQVQNVVNSPKYAKMKIKGDAFLKSIDDIFPKGKNIGEAIDEIDASAAQKRRITEQLQSIFKLFDPTKAARGQTYGSTTVPQLWAARKELDKVAYGNSWSPEAQIMINKIHGAMNAPIKGAGKEVENAFGIYHAAVEKSDEVEKFFQAQAVPESVQGFRSVILGPKIYKTATGAEINNPANVEALKYFEKYLDPSHKVVDELLNYGAAREIMEPIATAGMKSGAIAGATKARQTLAKTGSALESFTTPISKRLPISPSNIVGKTMPAAGAMADREQELEYAQ